MLRVSLFVGLLLALLCWFGADRLKARGSRGFAYRLFRNGFRSLRPFVIVLGVHYLALAYFRSHYASGLSLNTLVAIEETLERAKHLVGPFTLNHVAVFVVLVCLYLAVGLGLSGRARDRLQKGAKIYKNTVGVAFTFLVLLTSFTFLGALPGDPQLDATVRIKTARTGYATLRREVASTVAQQVAQQLSQKTYSAFPDWYGKSLDLAPKISSEWASLSAEYAQAAAKYGVKDPRVDTLVARYSAPPQGPKPEPGQGPEPGPGQGPKSGPGSGQAPSASDEDIVEGWLADRPAPGTVSVAEVADADRLFVRYKAKLKTAATTFLERPGAKEVVLEFPKLLTGQGREIFSALSAHVPIMGPVIDTMVDTVDEAFGARLQRAIDRAMGEVLDGRPQAVSAQAEEVVQQTPVVISHDSQAKAGVVRSSLEASFGEIVDAHTRLTATVQQAKTLRVDGWIRNLVSSNAETRKQAVDQLEQNGGELSRSQVDELTDMMRNGHESWDTFLYREEAHHCSWYELATVKHYAGEVLSRAESPFINRSLAEEGRKASNEGLSKHRRTDPGWI